MTNLHNPPANLSTDMQAWWHRVVEDYSLEPHHLRLLTLACEAWDQAALARAILGIAGLTFTDKWNQPRARPEVAIEQQARRDFARLLRELGLESSGPELPRPPALRR